MLEDLGKSNFDNYLNTLFSVRFSGEGSETLELVGTSGSGGEHTESFSVVFRSSGQQVYPQKIYSLEHEDLGSFELFLVPVKKDAQGVYYEAVFNRLLKKQQKL